MGAVARGSCDSVNVLLRHKSNPNLKKRDGTTALHIAADSICNEEEIIETLLNNGSEIDARDAISRTPLMYAVINANYDSIVVLLSHGSNVNLKDENGRSALLHARGEWADDVYSSIVDLLL